MPFSPLQKLKTVCYTVSVINLLQKAKITMKLETGRPANTAGRLEKEVRSYDFLDSLQVFYQRVDHDPAMTMEQCEEADRSLNAMICKNLLLCNRPHTEFYLLLLPWDKHFKTGDMSKRIGASRLSFAEAEYMEAFLDITPGSLSILGLMNDKDNRVQLVIDSAVLQDEYFACHPCINTSSLKMSMADLTDKVIPALKHPPRIIDFD